MKERVTIHIGGVYGSAKPAVIYTLLGSCVAVCLFEPLNAIGAMNHILLPGEATLKQLNAATRFGINAMELLINRMMQLGADRRKFVAKIFGGAHVLPSISPENGVGRKIFDFVAEFLENERIPLISKDIGGRKGRKVWFHTDTGDVFVKTIEPTLLYAVQREEKRTLPHVVRESKKPGQITFFY